jgi:hypothetical protein
MQREQWYWTFWGYESRLKNRPVAVWINKLSQPARDELVDVLCYMRVSPNNEWLPQHFRLLDDGISEIRFQDADHWLRIYGFFWPDRMCYTMLHGTEKKVKNDKDGKNLAKSRRDELKKREASVHLFSVEE